MSGISVSISYIDRYRKFISEAKHSVNKLVYRMTLMLKDAGSTWDDKNYEKFEDIAIECVDELQRVYEIILHAEQYLDWVYNVISEYEGISYGQIHISSSRDAFLLSSGLDNIENNKQKKLYALKKGLSEINVVLQSYRNELTARGIGNGITISVILDHFRHQLQADLLGHIKGAELPPRSTPDFDAIAENVQWKRLDQFEVEQIVPRNLSHTEHGFQNIVFQGRKMYVYDDPIGTGRLLIQEQGNSQYPMLGTCGLCQSANVLTMAGVPMTEDDIISIALHSSDEVLRDMELFEEDLGVCGGTTVRNRQEILESQGIPITNLPINIDRDYTVRQLASAVISGHGVILSVDTERLWRNGQSGGHAITLLSVTGDSSTFIYSDSGYGGIAMISATDLAAALTGRPANITVNSIR